MKDAIRKDTHLRYIPQCDRWESWLAVNYGIDSVRSLDLEGAERVLGAMHKWMRSSRIRGRVSREAILSLRWNDGKTLLAMPQERWPEFEQAFGSLFTEHLPATGRGLLIFTAVNPAANMLLHAIESAEGRKEDEWLAQ